MSAANWGIFWGGGGAEYLFGIQVSVFIKFLATRCMTGKIFPDFHFSCNLFLFQDRTQEINPVKIIT